jgi:hypothetical protein
MGGVRSKLLLPVSLGLAGLLFTSMGLALVHFVPGPTLQASVHRDLRTAATQLAEKLDTRMAERWQDITLAARRQVLRERAGETPEREVVDEIKARHPRYVWVGFTDENCFVRVSTERSLDGTDVEERPWCREARRGAFVGDVHEAKLLKSRIKDLGQIGLLMDIAVPVRLSTNTVTGVLAAHLMADWLIDVNASMQEASPVETLILTAKGQVIVGPPVLMGHTLDEPTFAQVKASGVGRRPWLDGAYVSTAVATKGVESFPGLGWIAVARLSQEQAGASERRILLWVLISGIALSLALALVGVVPTRRFAAHGAEWVPENEPAEPSRPKVPVRTGAE